VPGSSNAATNQIFVPAETSTQGTLGTVTITGTADVWPIWVEQQNITVTSNVTVTAANTGNVVIWRIWNETITGSITTATSNTSVMIAAANLNGIDRIWPLWNQQLNESEEQVQVRLRREAEYRERRFAVEAENAKARDRAVKLLQEALSPEQRAEFADKGFFHLATITKEGQRRRYRIERGRSRNVKQVDDSGRVLKTLCAHPVSAVPDEDTMLAQKLWLEAHEDEFLRIANHS
jgi:hypothetical protein